MLRVSCAAVLAASVVFASTAVAQSTPPARVGVIGGVSIATLGGKDVDDADYRVGFVGGGTLVLPLQGRFAFEVNALYAMKGAKASDAGQSVTFKVDYLELPLLLRYDFTGEKVRPHLAAGVSFGYQASCKAEGAAEGINAEVDCSVLEDDAELDIKMKKFDTGIVVGGGLDFLSNDKTFTLGARYTHGVNNIVERHTVQNRAFSVYAGFTIPVNR